MVKAPTRYRSYGRQMALALNRGRHDHFDQQVKWYNLDLRREKPEDRPRAVHAKERAFWEFRSDKVYPCKEAIQVVLKAFGPQDITYIRKECAKQCSDYSVENVNAAINDLVKENVIVHKEEINVYDLKGN